MKMEFTQMQENMEDTVSKILAETKKAATMKNAIPTEETSQVSVVESDFEICIDEVSSEKASVLPHIDTIEEEPFLLEDYEVSQTDSDDPSISVLNKFPPQSNIGVNAKVKTIDRQSCVERNSDGECSDSVEIFLDTPAACDEINAFKVDARLIVGNNKRKQFSCKFCDKSFNNKTHLKLHIRTHTGERPYQCQVCYKSFSQNSSLQTHMRIHTGERPYQCQVCEKSFTQSSSLQTHIRMHNGVRPYQCEVCHKSFACHSNLQTHMNIHTEEQPYLCDVCHKSFARKSNFLTHMRIHTGKRPYQCEVCHKSFTIKCNLQTHMNIHTGERPYQCQECQKSFTQKSSLQRHMAIHTERHHYND